MSVEVWKDSYKLLEIILYLKKVLVVPPHLHSAKAGRHSAKILAAMRRLSTSVR
jgi:hypothetical protein